jgi:hypothetical protein
MLPLPAALDEKHPSLWMAISAGLRLSASLRHPLLFSSVSGYFAPALCCFSTGIIRQTLKNRPICGYSAEPFRENNFQ